jgi:hypothetical protein
MIRVHDYPVKRMSQDEIENAARSIRAACGIADVLVPDVLDLIRSKARRIKRARDLTLVIRPDGFMGDREAYAVSSPNRIFARADLIDAAARSNSRARVILIHEFSHIYLHPGAEKAWMTSGNVTPSFIPEEESAEWQATALCLAILVDARLAANTQSPVELAETFNIDLEHAELRYEVLNRRKGRVVPAIYKTILHELREKSGRSSQEKPDLHFISECCPECGQQKILPIGIKYLCHNFGLVTDHFQDGDRADY